METFVQDVRYAFRNLLSRPGFTVLAILCLGLGIGVNTAAFSFVNEFFIHQLPVKDSDGLVRVYNGYSHGFLYGELSYAEFAQYKARSQSFSGLIGESFLPMGLKTETRNERIYGSVVTGDYFDVLGVKPALGRTFLPEEDRLPGAHPVAVVSHGMWERRFGADPGLLGRTVTINGVQLTVIGVAPRGFSGTLVGLSPEVWIPVMMLEQLRPGTEPLHSYKARLLFTLGRLKPGVTIIQARTEMNEFAQQLKRARPDELQTLTQITIIPLNEGTFSPQLRNRVRIFLTMLMAIVGLVLLIACANVAGLLVARATERTREIGIRQAMGASRLRILRQLLTESAVLALLSAGFGLLLAWLVGRMVLSLTPPSEFPLSFTTRIDGYVLGFTIAVALVTVLAFGLLPALQASRPDLVRAVKNEVSSEDPTRKSRLRSLLVIGQVALSVFLLVSATLFVRSLQNAHQIDIGFDPERVVIASVDVSLHGYDEVRGRNFYRDVQHRLEGLPGVQAVSLLEKVPFHIDPQRTRATPEGYVAPADGSEPLLDYSVAGPRYFETLSVPILRGRDFRDSDNQDSPKVAIINEALAKKFWPNEDPIGKRLLAVQEYRQIVGVVKMTKYRTLGEEPLPYLYLPFSQNYEPEMAILVRSSQNPAEVLRPMREQIQSLDTELILFNVMPMQERLKMALLKARMGAYVFGTFGILALLLSTVGLYGVLSYSVRQRTREIGIRMALGASGQNVARLVVRQVMKLVLSGAVIGLLLSFAATKFMASQLYGVSTRDPIVFSGTAILLVLVGLLACLLPVMKAARLSPTVALRYD